MAVDYIQAATSGYGRYVTSNNGQGICTIINLNGDRLIKSFAIGLGRCRAGYNGGAGSSTGVGRYLYGAIWFNEPTRMDDIS